MKVLTYLLALLVLFLSGCGPNPKSGMGFTLPEGDASQGEQTFARLQCQACHTVEGVVFERDADAQTTLIALGGGKPYVKTYGDLVTSIINPSHRFAAGYAKEDVQDDEGRSRMRRYNDEMTVTELTDLVTFLQTKYRLEPVQTTPYVPYY